MPELIGQIVVPVTAGLILLVISKVLTRLEDFLKNAGVIHRIFRGHVSHD